MVINKIKFLAHPEDTNFFFLLLQMIVHLFPLQSRNPAAGWILMQPLLFPLPQKGVHVAMKKFSVPMFKVSIQL